MSLTPVNIAVVDNKTIVKADVLSTAKGNAPVKIKAIAGGKYILSEGKDGVAPENVTLKRVGKNLHVILEGSDIDQPQLIIENFYDNPGELVGKGEDGQWHAYTATSGDENDEAAFLMDGESSAVALGAASIAGLDGLTAAGTAFSPALIALGVLGALAAATGIGLLVAGSGGGGGGGPRSLPTPSIIEAYDDVEPLTGTLRSGDSTDDSTPTLSGTGTPGNTVEIWDNGVKIGEQLIGDDGKWSFITPPLIHGPHSITVVEKDPDGRTSEPSDPFELNIDLEAPDRAELNEVWDDVEPRTGLVSNGGSTNDQQPDFRGKAEPLSEVEITLDGVVVARVPVNADGDWSWTPSTPLGEGNHTVSLVVIDPVGNPSLPTPDFNFTVDITPPVMIPSAFDMDNVIDDVGMKTGPIARDSITDDNRPTFNGSGLDAGDTVEVWDVLTNELLGTAIVKADGTWSFTPDEDMSEGPHSVSVTIVDPAGLSSDPSPTFEFVIDTTRPPKPTGDQFEGAWDDVGPVVGQIENGSTTDDTQPEFKGTGLTPGHIVHIRETGVDQVFGTAIVDENGNWTWTPADDERLGTGDYVFVIEVEDEIGRVSDPSDPIDFTIDVTPPTDPIISDFFDDQGAVTGANDGSTPTDDAQPEFRGTGEPGSFIWVYIDGDYAGSAMVDINGSWSFTPNFQLINGPHRVTAQAHDDAGNRSGVSLPFDLIVQTGGIPDNPAITGVIDNVPGGIVGNIGPGGLTNDPRPEITGTAPAGTVVEVFIDGIPIGTVTSDAFGQWRIESNRDLENGERRIIAQNADGSGSPSGEYVIIVDVVAPTMADDLDLWDDVPAVTGSIGSGDTTDDRTPTFTGTGGEPGDIVYVYDDGELLGTTVVKDGGTWEFPSPPLDDGDHSFTVIIEDEAGNKSPETAPIDFTVDTSAVLISIDYAEDNVGSIRDNLYNGASTDDDTPTLRGEATPNSLVSIYLEGNLIDTVMSNGRGEWVYTITLPEGQHRITATVTTPAGGESAPTGEFVLNVDLTAPDKPAIDRITDDVGPLQGDVANNGYTDDSTPTLVGVPVEPNGLVIIYDRGLRIDSIRADGDGNWSWTPATPLNDGEHIFTVEVQDAVGHVSERSDPWTINIDTEAPGRPIIGPEGELAGAWDDVGPFTGIIEDLTDDNRPTFAGGGGTMVPGNIVEVWDEFPAGTKTMIGTAIVDADGNWTLTPEVGEELADGDHKISIIVVEPTGQRSPESDQIEFEVDTTPPPAPVITGMSDAEGPITDGTTRDPFPTIIGTAEPGTTVFIYDQDDQLLGSTTADPTTGDWTFVPSRPLEQGTTELTAVARDPAGNTGAPSAPAPIEVVSGGVTPDITITGVYDDVVAHTGLIEKEGLSNDPTPTLRGTGPAGTIVHVFDETRGLLGTVTVDAEGRWELEVGPLVSGDYNFTAQPELAGGGLGTATGEWPIVIDVDAPANAADLSLWDDEQDNPATEIINGGTTDDATPTLKGTAEPGATVIVRDENGDLVGTAVADATTGEWSVTPSTPLRDGDHSFTTEVIDEAGNTSGEQPGIDFTVDTSRLEVSITHVVDDEGSITGNIASGGKTDDTTPTVHGRATPNSIVTISVDGMEYTVRTNAFGFWEQELALTQGIYPITASVTNASGTTTTNEFVLEIDTTAPNRAVIDRVMDDVGVDQGNVPSGGKTDDNTPTVEGRGVPGDIVTVYVDDVPMGTRVVSDEGTWSFTLPPQEDGVKQISVSFTDDVGNEGDRSENWELNIDTVPPAGAITAATNNNDPADLVDVPDNGYSNDTTPVISGTGEEGAIVHLYDQNDRLLGSAVVTGGVWQIETIVLTEDTYTLRAEFDDGVHKATSNEWVITIDTTPPGAGTFTEILDNFGPTTGPVTSGMVTDDATPTLKGTGEPNSWVFIYNGADTTNVLGSVQVDRDGDWELELATLPDGTYNFEAVFRDEAGNVGGRTSSWPIIIDSYVPGIPGTGPGGALEGAYDDVPAHVGVIGDLTNDNRPELAGGGLRKDDIVNIYDEFPAGTKTLIGTAIVDELGNWTFTPEVGDELSDGEHSFTIIVEATNGNVSPESAPLEFEVDTTPPPAPVITTITDADGPVSGGSTADPFPTISGTSEPGSTVYIYDQYDNLLGTATAGDTAPGNWSFTPSLPLPQGELILTAVAEDKAGNTGAPSAPETLDIISGGETPDITITGVYDDVAAHTGLIEKEGLSNDPTPTLRGTGPAGTVVHVFDETRGLLGTVTVDAEGRWELEVGPLVSGDYNFTAQPELAGGGLGTATGEWPIVIDVDAPANAADLSLWDDEQDNPATEIINGGTTDDATPTLKGTAEPGATVIVRDENGDLVGTAVADATTGEWSVTPSTPLRDGDHSFTTEVIDEAGNTSGEQPGIDFTVDTSRLEVSITHVVDDEGSITGNIASGGKTDDTTPTVHGRATPNSIVTISVDGMEYTVRTNAFGFWEQELALTQGIYPITASVTNASGTTTTNEFVLEIDTTAPNRAVIDRVMDDVGVDQGNVPSGGKTDDNTPTVEGRGVPGDIVTVYVDDVPMGTRVVGDEGTWSFTLPPQEDGVKQISVSFTDDVGNEGERSAEWEIIIDTVPPAGAITAATNNTDPASPVDVVEGGYTFDPTPVISGTGEEGATVRLYDQTDRLLGTAIVTGGVWQIETALMAEGAYVLKAVFNDGVYETESAEWAINIDTTLPTGTINQIYDDVGRDTGPLLSGARTDDGTPTLSGTTEPWAMVYIYNGAGTAVLGSGQADEFGNWSFDVAVPRDGTYDFTAQFVDRAGNESAARADSWPITVDRTPPTVGRITNAYDDFGASTGNVTNGGKTDDLRPTYSGTGEEGSIVRLWEGGTQIGSGVVTGGTWTITPNRDFSGTGLHTVTATFEDDLGNRSGHSPGYAVDIGADFTLSNFSGIQQAWTGSVYLNGAHSIPQYQTSFNIDMGQYNDQSNTPNYVRVGFWGGVFPVPGLVMTLVVNGARHTMTHGAPGDSGVWHVRSFNLLAYQNSSFSFYIESNVGGDIQTTQTYTATLGNRTGSTFSLVEPDDGAILAASMVEKQEEHSQSEPVRKEAVVLPEVVAEQAAEAAAQETIANEELVAEAIDPEAIIETEAALLASAAEVEGTEGEIDTWEITGSDLVIDLAKYAAALESVEVIDITGDGDNTLNISLGDILVHGEKDLFVADGKVQMMVKGNEGDVVNLSDLLPDGSDTGDWNAGENVWVEGVEYTVYAHTGQAAEVLIQQGIQTNLENH
jgi:hypothetical protein